MEREKIEKLRALEAKWRQWPLGGAHQSCADELAQLLSELDAPAAPSELRVQRKNPKYHAYVSNMASRDPSCSACGGEMSEEQHIEWLAAPPEAAREALREAAQGLVNKLDLITKDDSYLSVWVIAAQRLGPYKGPNWVDELDRVRAALKSSAASAAPVLDHTECFAPRQQDGG